MRRNTARGCGVQPSTRTSSDAFVMSCTPPNSASMAPTKCEAALNTSSVTKREPSLLEVASPSCGKVPRLAIRTEPYEVLAVSTSLSRFSSPPCSSLIGNARGKSRDAQ